MPLNAPTKPAHSRRRLWLFRFVALIFPFALLSMLELLLRVVPAWSEDRDPFVNISPVSVFSRTTVDGLEYYNITHHLVLGGSSVRILVKKPTNTL